MSSPGTGAGFSDRGSNHNGGTASIPTYHFDGSGGLNHPPSIMTEIISSMSQRSSQLAVGSSLANQIQAKIKGLTVNHVSATFMGIAPTANRSLTLLTGDFFNSTPTSVSPSKLPVSLSSVASNEIGNLSTLAGTPLQQWESLSSVSDIVNGASSILSQTDQAALQQAKLFG